MVINKISMSGSLAESRKDANAVFTGQQVMDLPDDIKDQFEPNDLLKFEVIDGHHQMLALLDNADSNLTGSGNGFLFIEKMSHPSAGLPGETTINVILTDFED